MTTRLIATVTFIVASAYGILAQSPLAFEVSTVKPSSPDARGRSFRFVGAHRFTANNHTLKECIGFAYDLSPALISGGPDWADSERYDIVAEFPGETRPGAGQIQLMFRALLADRFQLKFHREEKQVSLYNLVRTKNLLKITESTADPARGRSLLIQNPSPGVSMLPGRNATMADLAALLQRVIVDRTVVDKTGLAGRYDFTLEWTRDLTSEGTDKPDIFGALQQLGLKLESAKGPVEVLVIDSAAKAEAN